MLKYFYLTKQNLEYSKTLHNLQIENNHYSDRVKRLQPNTIDLDFLEVIYRQKFMIGKPTETIFSTNK